MPSIDLKNYPLKMSTGSIAQVTLPFPSTFQESYAHVQNVSRSESGLDYVQVMRTSKLTLSLSFHVTGDLVATFDGFANAGSTIYVRMFDHTEQDYVEKNMYITAYNKSLDKRSELLTAVPGVYVINMTLVQL